MDFVLPIKITELGENDYYFESPNKDMELYGTAESLSQALEFAKESIEFSLFDLFDAGDEFPTFELHEYSQLEKK